MNFDGKTIRLKFTNLIEHKLVLSDLRYSDLYALPRGEEEQRRFCEAWAIVLGVELDCTPAEFIDSRLDVDLIEVQKAVEAAHERDCRLIETNSAEPIEEAKKKDKRELEIQYLKWREFVCQNCNVSRREFDCLTPLETQIIQIEYKDKLSMEAQKLRVLDEHFARLEFANFGNKRSKISDFRILKDEAQKPKIKTAKQIEFDAQNLKRKADAQNYLKERAKKYGR